MATASYKATPEEAAYELRAQESSLWIGSRLAIGILTFAFASLAFAYFYLRSTNSYQLWRPRGITAPTTFGGAIFATMIASSVLVIYGAQRHKKGAVLDWQVAWWTAVIGSLLALGLQVYQLTQLPFFPGRSGYTSCFIGWAGMNIALIAGSWYWLETLLARATRLKRALAQDGGSAVSNLPAARLFRANIDSCAYFWGFVGLVSGFFWLLFYII